MIFRSGFRFAAFVAVGFFSTVSGPARGQSETPIPPNGDKVTVRGAIGGAYYVDIHSPIEGTIHKVAPEGPVNRGDLVVELDKTSLERQVKNQQNVVARAEAERILAQIVVETARSEWAGKLADAEGQLELAKLAYEKFGNPERGEHKVALEAAEREIAVVKKQLSLAEKRFARLKELAESEPDALEQAELEVLKMSVVLDAAEARHKQLRTLDYEFRRKELQLALDKSAREAKLVTIREQAAMFKHTAEADAKGVAFKYEQEKLKEMQQQIQSCRIDSPLDGFLTVAKQPGGTEPVAIEPGSTVRARQRMLRIHDRDRLQLKGFVNLKLGKRIRVGAPAVIKIDAFPDASFSGQVGSVSLNTGADSMLAKGDQRCVVIVLLNESPHGAKPDLTAVAEIDASNPE